MRHHDRPTLNEMLAPAIDAGACVLISPYTRTFALVLLGPVDEGTLELALDLHAALDRGLLVLA